MDDTGIDKHQSFLTVIYRVKFFCSSLHIESMELLGGFPPPFAAPWDQLSAAKQNASQPDGNLRWERLKNHQTSMPPPHHNCPPPGSKTWSLSSLKRVDTGKKT